MKLEWIEKYMTEAETLIYENKVSEGLNLLNSLLFDEPGYGPLHNHLGWAYTYYTADESNAELHLRMAIKFAPEFAAPYLHMGTLLNRVGRNAEALENLRAGMIKPGANKVAFLEAIAFTYEMTREYSKAIQAYKEASLQSVAVYEMDRFKEGINRCRRKKLVLLFTF